MTIRIDEDDEADDDVAADDEAAEGLDDLAGVAVEQDQPGAETFSARRNRVATSSTVGKTENWSGSVM